MTMYEITYCFEHETCSYGHYTGVFFSADEWKAYKADCKADGEPVIALDIVHIDPMEWYKKAIKSGEYEWPYIVEIMAIATFGQEECRKYDKWADLELLLKLKGII